jgi:transcriptional regulator with XRE-family HTH domain
MTTNKEKFLALVSKEQTSTLERSKARIKNRAMLRESQQIAIKVLKKMEDLGWSQKELARKMNVSPQQINKIVKGQENLTLETQIKLQNILCIPILASYYEAKLSPIAIIFSGEKKFQPIQVASVFVDDYQSAETVKLERIFSFSDKSLYQEAIL